LPLKFFKTNIIKSFLPAYKPDGRGIVVCVQPA
jgi:hypothetical protein